MLVTIIKQGCLVLMKDLRRTGRKLEMDLTTALAYNDMLARGERFEAYSLLEKEIKRQLAEA